MAALILPSGHLQVVGARGHRKWRAFWWDADGKHSRVIGRAWAPSSGKRAPRGAVIWHAADGPKPVVSHAEGGRSGAAAHPRARRGHEADRAQPARPARDVR